MALFLFAGTLFSQEEKAIPWSPDIRLTWQDFKGRPFKTAWAAAVTASGIAYQFSSMERDGKMELEIEVGTYFYPHKSWYQPKLCDSIILSHEQLHFDISELFARKMRKRLGEATFTKNIKAEIKAIYQQILKELTEFQRKYDYETDFSRNVQKQLYWNQRIENDLMLE